MTSPTPGAIVAPGGGIGSLIDRLALRTKLLTLLVLAVVVAGTCVAVGAQALRSTARDIHQINEIDVAVAVRAADATTNGARFRRMAVQLILAHTTEQVDATKTKIEAVLGKQDATLAELQKLAPDAESRALADQAATMWSQLKDLFATKIEPQAVRTDLTLAEMAALADVAYGDFGSLADKLASTLDALKKRAGDDLSNHVLAAQRTATNAESTLLGGLAVGVVLLLAAGTWVGARTSRRLGAVRDAVVRLGDGDLTARADGVTAEDEIGSIATALNRAQEALHESMTTILSSSTTLAGSAEELSVVSSQVAASAEETSVQSGTAASAAEEVSRNVQTVAAATEEMSASIREISLSSTEAVRVAQSAADEARNATGTVSKLGDSSREIGDVVKVITSIAEQTNLLALNATIEAARAGEAGKGFAVVASEVKDLAQETARATEDISRRIEAIQTDSEAAVAAIARISEIIEEVNSYQTTIASAVEEQTATTSEMSRNVQEASSGAGGIAGNIEYVATAAQSSSTGIVEAQRAAAELAQLSGDLRELVARYRV